MCFYNQVNLWQRLKSVVWHCQKVYVCHYFINCKQFVF